MRAIADFLDNVAPEGSRRRGALGLLGVVVLFVVLQVAVPRPATSAVLFRGLLAGCSTALLATGIVLVHRSARIVNFAQAALGAIGAYLAFVLVQVVGVPFFIGLPIAVLVGALTGLLVDGLFVQRFFNSPRLVLTVVTIVVARVVGAPRGYVHGIPGLSARLRMLDAQAEIDNGVLDLPFDGIRFSVSNQVFGFGALLTVFLTVAALGTLSLFLRTSRFGTAIRGTAANPERAVSLGINVRVLSSAVWAIAGGLSGLAVFLMGMNRGGGFSDPALFDIDVLIPAVAAAVLARMRSIPVAATAAVAITLLTRVVDSSYTGTPLVDIAILVAVTGALLLQRQGGGRSEQGQALSWDATKENRPVPKELAAVPGVRRSRWGLIAFAVAVVVIFPFASSDGQVNLATLVFVRALVGLSLVVLTGWSGQVSLGQFAFVAVAAMVGGHLTAEVGLSFWIALPLVTALGGGLAVLVGLPALRIDPSYLAVTTFLMAGAVQRILFDEGVQEAFAPERVYRPGFLFVSFASERNYYFLCFGFVVLAAWVVSRLRASGPGRLLIALRENEPGVQSFGVAAVRTRLAGFVVSGALASVAGMLFVHHQRALDDVSYMSSASVDVFVMAMIGGISSVTGALLGAAYLGLATLVIADDVWRNLATSGGLLLLLVMAPGGLAGIAASVRDNVLRVVATRRGIPVPSLFADGDYEAMLAQRQPLAEPLPYRGLEAIPGARRYRRHSDLHGRAPAVEGAAT